MGFLMSIAKLKEGDPTSKYLSDRFSDIDGKTHLEEEDECNLFSASFTNSISAYSNASAGLDAVVHISVIMGVVVNCCCWMDVELDGSSVISLSEFERWCSTNGSFTVLGPAFSLSVTLTNCWLE